MLQKLRDQTQGTGFKILVGAIIVVLTLFGFGATNLFLAGDPEVARVGDVSITQNQLAVETQRERARLLSQLGPDFDPANIDLQQLSTRVIQQLVSRQVMYQTSAELGVEMPPDLINETLTTEENFRVDGRFNEAVYRQYIQAMGYTPLEFLEEFTRSTGAEHVVAGIRDSNAVADWELAEIVRVISQRRDLAYLPLTVDLYGESVSVADEEIEIRYDEEQSNYMTPLTVDAEYLVLGVQDLLNDTSIEVSEEELASLYKEEKTAALRDEQRASSHILLQVNDDRDDASARAEIEAIAARLEAGEVFEDLAESLSEDPGSAPEGGSLGAVSKGIFDPAFETALWALENEGDVSQPVRSMFGYHLIRLDGVVAPDYPDFATLKEQLELRVRREKALALFSDRARELEDLAYDEQVSLTETAASLGLELTQVDGVVEDESSDTILSQPNVRAALFEDDVLSGNNSAAIPLSEEQIVVVRVAQQYPPTLRPLEEVREEIRANLVREKSLNKIAEYKAQGMARLEAGDSVAEIADSLGSRWQTIELARRSPATAQEAAQMPNEVREMAFSLPRPKPGAKSIGVVDLADGAALVTVTRVVQGDIDATPQAELAELRRASEGRAGRLDLQSVLQASERNIGVERPQLPAVGEDV